MVVMVGVTVASAIDGFLDNGVLSAVFQDAPPKRVVELSERRYARPTVSRTFEGRDRFAPAAAFLAKGIHLEAFGRLLAGPILMGAAFLYVALLGYEMWLLDRLVS